MQTLKLVEDAYRLAELPSMRMEFALTTLPVGLNLFMIKGVVEDATLIEVFIELISKAWIFIYRNKGIKR